MVEGSRGPRRPREAVLHPVGTIRSRVKALEKAPRQGREGAPDAWLEVNPSLGNALDGIAVGDAIIVITWLHEARRDVLKVHPRDDTRVPLKGVFATRSQDRPNPLGLHPVTVKRIVGTRLRIGPIEAIDGTPVIDIKRRGEASRLGINYLECNGCWMNERMAAADCSGNRWTTQ